MEPSVVPTTWAGRLKQVIQLGNSSQARKIRWHGSVGIANCAKSQTIHVNNLLESNGFCAFETKCKLFLNIQKVCSIMLKIIELEKCMDTPDLPGYIQFCREHHSPGAGFLQMNGFAFREEKELQELMLRIRKNGVELIDLTFYGNEEYHDRFAGRNGDYGFLILCA